MYFPCFEPFYLTQSTVATAFHHECDDPVLFSCFPCFKPFYLNKSTVATAFHYQCDDPMLFSCFPCFKPFYLNKSTVATTYFTTSVTIQCCFPVFPCFKPFYLNKSTVATTYFTTSVTIQCCFPVFPVSNHSISPKALLLLRISPLVWRSSAVFLFQTILSHQKHCCYYASPPVWRSNEVLLFSLFQTILSHQKHFSPKALLLLRISPPVWRSGAVFPVLNHSISPKALLLLHFTTSVTIQCCFPCFKPFYLTKSTVATAFSLPVWRSSAVFLFQTILSHQKHCCYYAFHHQCDDPVLFSCFPCFKPFYLTKSTVATAFHYQCDDPVQFCCFPVSNHSISPKALLLLRISPRVWRSSAVLLFPCFKPFYLTKSTVATTHFTTSVTIQCSSAVSNHSILPKALLLLHFTTSVTIQTILSHQKHCCYYASHCISPPVQLCCFLSFKPFLSSGFNLRYLLHRNTQILTEYMDCMHYSIVIWKIVNNM